MFNSYMKHQSVTDARCLIGGKLFWPENYFYYNLITLQLLKLQPPLHHPSLQWKVRHKIMKDLSIKFWLPYNFIRGIIIIWPLHFMIFGGYKLTFRLFDVLLRQPQEPRKMWRDGTTTPRRWVKVVKLSCSSGSKWTSSYATHPTQQYVYRSWDENLQ